MIIILQLSIAVGKKLGNVHDSKFKQLDNMLYV